MRFQYKHPRIYDFLISFIYPKELLDKFSAEVGKNNSVFDIAAGYGRMSNFIDPSNSYYGIDLNKIFIDHGRKSGLNLEVKNIFDETSYKKSDVFILVDVIHHLSRAKLQELFNLIFKYADKKVVVIEPAFVNLSSKYGTSGQIMDWFFRKMDDDGFNKINRWFTDEEYSELFDKKFDSQHGNDFSIRRQKVSNHYLVTFTRSNIV